MSVALSCNHEGGCTCERYGRNEVGSQFDLSPRACTSKNLGYEHFTRRIPLATRRKTQRLQRLAVQCIILLLTHASTHKQMLNSCRPCDMHANNCINGRSPTALYHGNVSIVMASQTGRVSFVKRDALTRHPGYQPALPYTSLSSSLPYYWPQYHALPARPSK